MKRNDYPNPVELWWLGYELSLLSAEASAVVSMRVMGMAGLWGQSRNEETRMVMEKPAAFAESGMAMWSAAVSGKRSDEVLKAGIKPLRKVAGRNARRLGRKGPRFPG
ncbi:antifreeze protein [Paracoccaceae bacterium GXU_MW_L88]